MAKIIEVNKNLNSVELEKELTKIQNRKKTIHLKKYVSKIDFSVDLQLQIDQLIYQPYGLTKEENKIIEGV